MMGFFSQPPPPPPPQLAVHMPDHRIYATGLLFVVISQVATIPICVLAFHLKKMPFMQAVCGAATAAVGLILPPLVAEWAIEQDFGVTREGCSLGRFLGATVYAFVALRMFGASVGSTPKGADVDVATWIAWCTAALDLQFDSEGKPVRPPSGAVLKRTGWLMLRLLGLSLISSLSVPYDHYPVTTLLGANGVMGHLARMIDLVYVHLVIIYLFLSMLMDVGAILLLLQNFQPIEGFDNPIFQSTSARVFWGKRWNLQVTTSFKRCVFKPLRAVGLSPTLAALVTFISSGLFHEYQFVLSFPTYSFGRESLSRQRSGRVHRARKHDAPQARRAASTTRRKHDAPHARPKHIAHADLARVACALHARVEGGCTRERARDLLTRAAPCCMWLVRRRHLLLLCTPWRDQRCGCHLLARRRAHASVGARVG